MTMGDVAFLGTGLMGGPMVRRMLGAGLRLRAWNRSPEKAAALAGKGALIAGSAREAVAGAAVVCLCLTDGAAVADVLFGVDGIAATLDPGAVIVDFSTIGPERTRELAARLAGEAHGVRWVDAPVTGGVRGAENGDLVILCGGEAGDVAAVRPVLDPLAKRVCHLGALGSGQAAKLCNQLIVGINVIAIAEALALGRAHGLDIAALPDALAGGWADSLPLQIIGPRMAAGVAEPAIVSVGTYAKDLALVMQGRPGRAGGAGLAAHALSLLREALDEGLGAADVTALLAFAERA